ncbi:MAG: alpha-amylase family glycosyl hydrolase [Flavobacterium sp.]
MRKNFYAILFLFISFFVLGQVTISPSTFNVDQQITITVNLAQTSCNNIPTSTTKVYMHAGIGDDNNAFGFSVVGNWGQDNGIGLMTNNGNGTWSITITPSVYFGLNATQQANATKLGLVFRNATGTQEHKRPLTPSGCGDHIYNVGTFQLNLTAPLNNSTTILSPGGNLAVAANNTGGTANYVLRANGSVINTQNNVSSYSFTDTNIQANRIYELEVTQGTSTIRRNFSALINPGTLSQAKPSGLEDGINYLSGDATKAILQLNAPNKDFVYVAGSFNNWQPTSAHAMRRDPSTGLFWLELSGLVPGQIYTYQYWVVRQNPIAGSPALVKTADMYSYMVLSPFDDPWIPSASYPNLPAYPQGQEREVSVLQTGQTPYPWSQATLNFQKPDRDKLVIYEVLVRDFDANRNYQDLINRMDYFKNLGINAIQLMPVMEYEGNESWGYNTSFHLALDKFYGTETKFKELIDLCHQNGIAVILDVALNHAFGRNPGVRMWMNDPDGDGWGLPTSENPYFNTTARHSYSVGEDFNHQSAMTQYYTRRVIKRWIEDFKIDGFRWDLTKGFTQNCSGGDDACTNAYQQDRVDVLRAYADYSWSLDPNHYVIFEHLGSDGEEQQWANYRLNEGKGIMLWGEMWSQYKQLAQGFSTGADIGRMRSESRGFQTKMLIGYPESHDKDRMMYEAKTFGNAGGLAPVQNNLNNALYRMRALGALSLLVPGPKMVWHFGALGMDDSIFTCSNGTVNPEGDAIPGDCKLDTKPQPQWVNNWLANPNRAPIYNEWARMIDLKKSNPVFSRNSAVSPDGNLIRPRIYIWDDNLPSSQLKNVVIIANMSVAAQNINPSFPYTGTWVNLMDNSTINVTNTSATINLQPGEYRIYGNQPAVLSDEFTPIEKQLVELYPNPTKDIFALNRATQELYIYSMTGQLVKTFKGKYAENHVFNVQDLNSGIYLIKSIDASGAQFQTKLWKQ